MQAKTIGFVHCGVSRQKFFVAQRMHCGKIWFSNEQSAGR
jgi:hypothetical protein